MKNKVKLEHREKPYTIRWWFVIYNAYSKKAFELGRRYMREMDDKILEEYSEAQKMVSWIESRLCKKYGKFDFDE